MNKKFMRGLAAFLAVVMMVPTTAFAGTSEQPENPDAGIVALAEPTVSISGELYDGGTTKNTATLSLSGVALGTKVDWSTFDTEHISLSGNTVTGKKAGTATVTALYPKEDGTTGMIPYEITVKEYKVATVSLAGTKTEYVVGQTISKSDVKVTVTYTDGTSEPTTDFSIVSPTGALKESDTELKISVKGTEKTTGITVVNIDTEALVEDIDIVSPTASTEFAVGGKLKKSDVSVKIKYVDGTYATATLADNPNITYSGIDFGANASYTFSADDAKNKPTLTVSYGNANASVTLNVKTEVVSEDKAIQSVAVTTLPTKTTYRVGEKLDLTGLVLTLTHGNGTTTPVEYNAVNKTRFSGADTTTPFSKAGTGTVTLTYTHPGDTKSYKATFTITVKDAAINFVELYNGTSSDYKYALEEDAKIKIGDDDLDWEDFFEYVYVQYKDGTKTKYEKIRDDDDLRDFFYDDDDVKLHLVVADKTKNVDEVEADDVKSGKVELELYLEYGGTKYTSASDIISFKMEISGIGCTVGLYTSSSSVSSSYTNVYDDLEAALEAIEAEDDIEDELGAKLSSRTIKIKLSEDQEFKPSSKNRFAPDYENDIIIDLNGYELELKSDWIDYDDCEDLKVVITNTNDDEEGTLIYSDLGSTLIVAEDSKLEFSKDKIPTDSDAEITLTLLRSSSSSTVLETKIFDNLKEALQAIEAEDDFEDEIGSELGSSNVIKIKLGEDQNLSTYEFAPDYDNAITIDLNGHTLKLKSEWIDYDDCEDLTVYITNSNKDDEATLTYSDLSKSIKLKQGDAALKFQEDKIPGLYKVTVADVSNGTVKADKETVPHGSAVTFTITPATGYAINTVKVGTKTITTSTDGYTVSTKGVGTYKMENVTADVTITVTFKKSATTTESSSSTTTTDTSNWKNPFTDISKSDAYYPAIAYVVQNGLFNGMSATKFEPRGTTTRAQYVTVLGRLAGVDVSKYKTSRYTDVSTSDPSIAYAVPYIEWASDMGIIQGYGNNKFGPKDNITHQQMYLMMYRYAMYVEKIEVSLAGVSLSNIRDNAEIATWAEDGVKFASRYGILITSGGKLTPADNALRCELAMLLHGFCTKVINK